MQLALGSVQRALLGATSPRLYGGCVDIDDRVVVLTWDVAPQITADEREDLLIAGTEVMADFPDGFQIENEFVEVADRTVPLQTVGRWVALQRGFRTSTT